MTQKLDITNRSDDDGNPAGGYVSCTGMSIRWQDGPLGRGEDRIAPNGAFVESVIEAARQRLAFYQKGKFHCIENQSAIQYLNSALECLSDRTQRREAAGIEGTHEGK